MNESIKTLVDTVINNPEVRYASHLGSSFSGKDLLSFDFWNSSVLGIKRHNEKYLRVIVGTPNSGELSLLVKAMSDLGKKYLDVIEKHSDEIKGKTYNEFLRHKLSFSKVKT